MAVVGGKCIREWHNEQGGYSYEPGDEDWHDREGAYSHRWRGKYDSKRCCRGFVDARGVATPWRRTGLKCGECDFGDAEDAATLARCDGSGTPVVRRSLFEVAEDPAGDGGEGEAAVVPGTTVTVMLGVSRVRTLEFVAEPVGF